MSRVPFGQPLFSTLIRPTEITVDETARAIKNGIGVLVLVDPRDIYLALAPRLGHEAEFDVAWALVRDGALFAAPADRLAVLVPWTADFVKRISVRWRELAGAGAKATPFVPVIVGEA